jgi:hypothetical protein
MRSRLTGQLEESFEKTIKTESLLQDSHMNVWLISTSGRRRKLRTIIENGGYSLQSADAVTIRADLLDSVSRAASIPGITIALDAVSLVASDVKIAIEKIRETDADTPLVLIVSGDTGSRESIIQSFALAGSFSVVFDDATEFDSHLLESIALPQSLAVDKSPTKRKWFHFFRKKDTGAKGDRQERSKLSKKEKALQKVADKEAATGGFSTRLPLSKRILYALSDNARAISLSLVLTIAASVVYYAISEKGLTFVEIGQYFSSAIMNPLRSFFGR